MCFSPWPFMLEYSLRMIGQKIRKRNMSGILSTFGELPKEIWQIKCIWSSKFQNIHFTITDIHQICHVNDTVVETSRCAYNLLVSIP